MPSNATDNCYRLHSREGEVTGGGEGHGLGKRGGARHRRDERGGHARAARVRRAVRRGGNALRACAGRRRAVAGKTTVAIGFPKPPQLRQDLRRAIQYCQPAIQPLLTLNSAYEGKLDLLVKVGKDGKVVETVLPEGVLPWMEEAAHCLEDRLDFYPARLNLEAVESWTMVPVDFNLSRNAHERVRLDAPTLRSGDAQILEAYRTCYPAGRSDEVRINYRITVTDGGRVRKAEVVTSSGDGELDQAGVCILRKLIFVPARRNGVNIESTLNWPILVRPPG